VKERGRRRGSPGGTLVLGRFAGRARGLQNLKKVGDEVGWWAVQDCLEQPHLRVALVELHAPCEHLKLE
jgi:hypothetical protein